MTEVRKCSACRHWRPRTAAHKGDCLKSGHYSNTYRLVGAAGGEVFEETRPEHWCVLFEASAAMVGSIEP